MPLFELAHENLISPYWRILPPAAWTLFCILLVVLQSNQYVSARFLMTLVVIPAGQWGCAFASWIIAFLMQKCIPLR